MRSTAEDLADEMEDGGGSSHAEEQFLEITGMVPCCVRTAGSWPWAFDGLTTDMNGSSLCGAAARETARASRDSRL